MTEDELTEEYLERFPTRLKNALEIPKHRRRFINRAKDQYAPVPVYRGIRRADSIGEDDFISIEEEAARKGKTRRASTIEAHSVSVNEDPREVIKSLSIPNKGRPAMGIAKGMMKMEYGPADFLEGRTHHNWYIFKDKAVLLKDEFEVCALREFKPFNGKGGEEYE